MGSTSQVASTLLVMENAVWAVGGGVSLASARIGDRGVTARTGWGQDSRVLFVSSPLLDGSEARCESAPMPAGPSRGCSPAAVGAGSSSGTLVALGRGQALGKRPSACLAWSAPSREGETLLELSGEAEDGRKDRDATWRRKSTPVQPGGLGTSLKTLGDRSGQRLGKPSPWRR